MEVGDQLSSENTDIASVTTSFSNSKNSIIIAAVMIVALLGSAIFFLSTSTTQKTSKKEAKTTPISTPTQAQVLKITSDTWSTYSFAKGNPTMPEFQIKYPEDWTYAEVKAGDPLHLRFYSGDSVIKKPIELQVIAGEVDRCPCKTTQNITIGNLPAKRVTIDAWEVVDIVKDGYTYSVMRSLETASGDAAYLNYEKELFNAMLATFAFTDDTTVLKNPKFTPTPVYQSYLVADVRHKVYTNTQYKYTFLYPADFIINYSTGATTTQRTSFLQKQGAILAQRLLVASYKNIPNISLKEFAKLHSASYTDSLVTNSQTAKGYEMVSITKSSEKTNCNDGSIAKQTLDAVYIQKNGTIVELIPNDSCETQKTDWFSPIITSLTF